MDSISEKQASEIFYRNINQPRPGWPDQPEFVVAQMDEREPTWVVYYQSKLLVVAGDISHALAGNGPYLVSQMTGEFEIAESYPLYLIVWKRQNKGLLSEEPYEHTSVPNHVG